MKNLLNELGIDEVISFIYFLASPQKVTKKSSTALIAPRARPANTTATLRLHSLYISHNSSYNFYQFLARVHSHLTNYNGKALNSYFLVFGSPAAGALDSGRNLITDRSFVWTKY